MSDSANLVPDEAPRTLSAAARRGRRIALVLFYGSVVAFTAALAGQITWHIWVPQSVTTPALDCRSELVVLVQAIETARIAAAEIPSDPEEALARFRERLSPAWDHHGLVAVACKRDPKLAEMLDTVERLRYAEENAVRRDAVDLSPLRRKVAPLLATPR